MKSAQLRLLLGCGLVLAGSLLGCGHKEFYIQPDVGPHGQVTGMKRVPYTPEQQAAHDETFGYPVTQTSDQDLASVVRNWPQLSAEQRASVAKSVRDMTGAQK